MPVESSAICARCRVTSSCTVLVWIATSACSTADSHLCVLGVYFDAKFAFVMHKINRPVQSLVCEYKITLNPVLHWENVLSTRSAMFLLFANLPTRRMSSTTHHILGIILASAFSVAGLQFGLPHGDLVKGQSYNFTYLPADGIVSILPS